MGTNGWDLTLKPWFLDSACNFISRCKILRNSEHSDVSLLLWVRQNRGLWLFGVINSCFIIFIGLRGVRDLSRKLPYTIPQRVLFWHGSSNDNRVNCRAIVARSTSLSYLYIDRYMWVFFLKPIVTLLQLSFLCALRRRHNILMIVWSISFIKLYWNHP